MPNPDAHGAAAVPRWPDTLQVSTSAQGSHVRLLRRRLAQWLGGDDLDADVIEDLVLAASEALENCCDHAFSGGHGAGTMTLTASQAHDRLVITVADDGSWQLEGAETGHRGRGLTMMRQLVDDVAIEAGPGGTSLALTRYV
ncbi:ATP-binding protein [Actinomycetospora callitridis]|jgi:serine/threonine-protein kinase RsbW|uniref:ATP-binding protein n=1 Tax=Actinomycetospora callitridis TaxID=913944 RepID=UPI00236616DF|nr:ATP-binding protein [Actinomycetospora callitridis]MDD7921774.1 ATP-binding protein [Actinomycetospora callitridis]